MSTFSDLKKILLFLSFRVLGVSFDTTRFVKCCIMNNTGFVLSVTTIMEEKVEYFKCSLFYSKLNMFSTADLCGKSLLGYFSYTTVVTA